MQKLTKTTKTGMFLLGFSPLIYIVIFAMIATVFGEEMLEPTDGGTSAVNVLLQVVILLGPLALIVLGLITDKYDQLFTSNKALDKKLLYAGVSLVVFSLLSALLPTGEGANIGAGVILIVGMMLILSGLAAKLAGSEPKK